MRWKGFLQENGLHLSWAIALTATLGSLYFSEILGYIPCKLCWYQRILMYPLVIILGIASVRKDHRQSLYVLPMALLGAIISTYHYLIQKIAFFKEKSSSCGIIPCDAEYINWLGFVTIPFLALIAFLLISLIHIFLIRYNKVDSDRTFH